MGEHTKTPWFAVEDIIYGQWSMRPYCDDPGEAIASIYLVPVDLTTGDYQFSPARSDAKPSQMERLQANAAFIVKAVNNHDALIAVQKAAYDYFMCAVQDEADDSECCVTEQQHELAKALREALRASTPDLHGEGK